MIKTITGLFDTMNDAQSAAKELMDRGISREDISLVARDTSDGTTHEHEVGAENGAGAGAVGGTVVGGAVGLLVGAGLLAIPGIGPVLAIGPLAAAIGTAAAAVGATALGAGVGAGIGGLAGGLIGAGVPEEQAHAYAEGVRRGGTLMTVNVESGMAERVDVDSVLRRYGVVDINQRGADWRSTGWDPAGRPDDMSNATGDTWKESSKVGTTAGAMSGAATGAAVGSVGGPAGAIIGGAAGAVVGAGAGAAGDVAGERSMPADSYRGVNEYDEDTSSRREMAEKPSVGSFGQYERDFQTHYQSTARAGGRPYEYYSPAYRFGYDMASDRRYPYGSWETIEPELRRNWNQTHADNSWDEFKASVRYAWEKAWGMR
jgi:hypothetical protein